MKRGAILIPVSGHCFAENRTFQTLHIAWPRRHRKISEGPTFSHEGGNAVIVTRLQRVTTKSEQRTRFHRRVFVLLSRKIFQL